MDEHQIERDMEQAQRILDDRIAETAAKAHRRKPTGRCLYCNDVLPAELSFCPPEAPGLPCCRDDYEAELAARQRSGAYRRV